jgi:hypothetical protein
MKSRLATFIFFLIAVAAFFISAPLWATDCRGNSCNGGGDIDIGGTNVDVGTDVTVGDTNVNVPITTGPTNVTGGDTTLNNESRAIALSNVLGDVDIAGCLGSTQWATPLFSKQKLVVNWPCLTEFYLRKLLFTPNQMMKKSSTCVRNCSGRRLFTTSWRARYKVLSNNSVS